MRIGKLSNADLERYVLSKLPQPNGGVIQGPGVGIDCAALRFGDGQIVLTADPITGTTTDIGRLVVQITCNDIAAAGIRPTALMLVIIAPPTATPEEIGQIMEQAAQTAKQINVQIIGGHTEISDAVNRFVLTATAIGLTYGGKLISAAGAKANDTLLMTKTAAIEGTAILAQDRADRLSSVLTPAELAEAAALIDQIGIIEEGAFSGGFNAHAIHDATEGGILGACWELAEASRLGCCIDIDAIPVHPLTRRICRELKIDPLRLIASGSLIIATDHADELIDGLTQRNIRCTAIGRLTQQPERLLRRGDTIWTMDPPEGDELYRAI